MSYIGNQSENKVSPAFMRETLSPDGSATYFDLLHDVPGYNAETLLVTVNNVIQEPVNAYTIINDANLRPRRLNFGVALASTDSLYVVHRGSGELYHTPPANSVGATALQDNLKSGNVDSFTATAGQTAFTLSEIPLNATSINVYVNGIFQKPTTNYTVTGSSTTLTLSSGILLNDEVDVHHNTIRSTVSHVPDGGVTTSKIADAVGIEDSYFKIPSVTTTQRDALTAAVGMIIYNTTLGIMQQYNAQGWASIDSPPTVSSLNYPGDDTALDTVGEFNLTSSTTASGDATITVSATTNLKQGMLITGTGIPSSATVLTITDSTHFELSANATATGSANVTLTCNTQTLVITGTNFQTGATVTIDGTAPSIVTRNSSTQITITGTPAKTAGTKVNGLVVTNPTGLSGSIDIDYSALPAWTTASGNVLTALPSTISTIDLAATSATSYAITSGALPTGLAMSTSTGDITGTMSGTAATYNFTVNATDAQAQSSPRLFNIILNSPKGISVTGGTLTTDGDYKVYRWVNVTQASAFTIYSSHSGSSQWEITNDLLDYLVVAGGASGGSNGTSGAAGGGGGAGEMLYVTSWTPTLVAHDIIAGTGGAAPVAGAQGVDGVDTKININGGSDIKVMNGGGGGGRGHSTGVGNAGGSGGGGTGNGGAAGGASSKLGAGLGNAGGTGYAAAGGGGGGGSASVGANAYSNGGGNGGTGTSNSITGSAVIYAMGGGGAGYAAADNFGLGGGISATTSGNGASPVGNNNGVAATTTYPGSGGGGASYDASGANEVGGAGSAGVVIIRWKFQ